MLLFQWKEDCNSKVLEEYWVRIELIVKYTTFSENCLHLGPRNLMTSETLVISSRRKKKNTKLKIVKSSPAGTRVSDSDH